MSVLDSSLLTQLPKLADPLPGGKNLTNAVDSVVNWARANSLWPLVFGTSCCAIEMMATGASKHDWARFGVEVARATPRQADLIILAGTIVEKMGSRLRTLYEQMPAPKYVIAMGACTISGGPFYYDSYAAVKGADRIIPVDVYVPGCPPRPEALLYGIMQLQELIKKESFRNPRRPKNVNHSQMQDLHTQARQAWAKQEALKQETLREEQERFKKENPKYRGHVYQRKLAEAHPNVKRELQPHTGAKPSEILELVRGKFPEVKVFEKEETAPEELDALGGDYLLDLVVHPDQYQALINYVKTAPGLELDYLVFVTAVDWKDHFDVVAVLLSMTGKHKVSIRASLPDRDNAEIASLSSIHSGAEWHEREVYDFFGIRFTGHPDLRRIFLDELENPIVGHPLRKDWEDSGRVVKRPY